MPSLASLAILLASLLVAQVAAVDRTKFRTCHETGFCRTHRNKQTPAHAGSMVRTALLDIDSAHHFLPLAAAVCRSLAPALVFCIGRLRFSRNKLPQNRSLFFLF